MLLPLAYYGNPILRKKAAPVKEINEEIRKLVADMIETMNAKDGIGIAAPQVQHSLALFVTRAPIMLADGEWEKGEIRVFINPKIVGVSSEQNCYSEGCLSIPKLYGDVYRPNKITVQAQDLNGNTFVEDFVGFPARVILHENDHINGVLFIDRLEAKERKQIESQLREIKKKFSSN